MYVSTERCRYAHGRHVNRCRCLTCAAIILTYPYSVVKVKPPTYQHVVVICFIDNLGTVLDSVQVANVLAPVVGKQAEIGVHCKAAVTYGPLEVSVHMLTGGSRR